MSVAEHFYSGNALSLFISDLTIAVKALEESDPRDAALKLAREALEASEPYIERCYPPACHDGSCAPDAGCDGICMERAACGDQARRIQKAIAAIREVLSE